MRGGSISFNSAFLGGIFFLAAAAANHAVRAQEINRAMPQRFSITSGLGSTVSVATLRIPEKAWRHFAKAKAAGEHHRLDELQREANKAIEIAPDFAQAYLLRADAELQSRAFEAAIEDVKQARRADPDAAWAGLVLAGAFNGLGRYEDARLVLTGLRGTEAQSWQAAYEGARAATGLHDVESGLYLSALALASAPENFPDAHLVRTNALLRARRWSEAQAQLELYLQSKGSEAHRSDALKALETVKQQIRTESLQNLAAR